MRLFGLLTLLAVLGLGLTYVGCASKATTATAPTASSSTPENYTFLNNIGFFDSLYVNESIEDSGWPSDPPPSAPVSATYDIPSGVAVGGGYLFVADIYNGYISKYDLSGNFISSWFANGIGGYYEDSGCPDCFEDFNVGMTTDNYGHLYVSNSYYSEVDIYDFNGNWLSYVDADDELECPTGVAVDAGGNVYVADICAGNGGIFKMTPSSGCCNGGVLLTQQYSSPQGSLEPLGIAVDAGGNNVYVSDYNSSQVQVYDTSLNWKSTIGVDACSTTIGCPTTVTGQLFAPDGLTLDNQGNLLVCDSEAEYGFYYFGTGFGRIEKFSPNGTYLAEIGANAIGSPTWANGQLYVPSGLAVDPNNNVYVADSGWDLVFKYAAP